VLLLLAAYLTPALLQFGADLAQFLLGLGHPLFVLVLLLLLVQLFGRLRAILLEHVHGLLGLQLKFMF